MTRFKPILIGGDTGDMYHDVPSGIQGHRGHTPLGVSRVSPTRMPLISLQGYDMFETYHPPWNIFAGGRK